MLNFKTRLTKYFFTAFSSLLFLAAIAAHANEVKVLAADFNQSGDHSWTVSVTLKHDDTGWEHYADDWRVVDDNDNILGNRVLFHPHVDEQPFTRSLGNVKIPPGISTVYIEAHDKLHGWSKDRLKVDLSKSVNGRLKVEKKQD